MSNSGFDVARFVDKPHPEMVCSICHGVFNNPYLAACEHHFCLECITLWAEKQNNCPLCRNPLTTSALQKPTRLVTAILNDLQLVCSFVAHGCDAQLTIGTVLAHERNCLFRLVVCGNEGCGVQVQQRHIAQHSNKKCEWRIVVCPNLCGISNLKANQLRTHTTTACPLQKVACTLGCGKPDLKRQDLHKHLEHNCPKQELVCVVSGCGFRAQRGAHEAWEKHMLVNSQNHFSVMIGEIVTLREASKLFNSRIETLELQAKAHANENAGLLQRISDQQQQIIGLLQRERETQQIHKQLMEKQQAQQHKLDEQQQQLQQLEEQRKLQEKQQLEAQRKLQEQQQRQLQKQQQLQEQLQQLQQKTQQLQQLEQQQPIKEQQQVAKELVAGERSPNSINLHLENFVSNPLSTVAEGTLSVVTSRLLDASKQKDTAQTQPVVAICGLEVRVIQGPIVESSFAEQSVFVWQVLNVTKADVKWENVTLRPTKKNAIEVAPQHVDPIARGKAGFVRLTIPCSARDIIVDSFEFGLFDKHGLQFGPNLTLDTRTIKNPVESEKENLNKLEALGFTDQEQCMLELRRVNGDVETAANSLLEGTQPTKSRVQRKPKYNSRIISGPRFSSTTKFMPGFYIQPEWQVLNTCDAEWKGVTIAVEGDNPFNFAPTPQVAVRPDQVFLVSTRHLVPWNMGGTTVSCTFRFRSEDGEFFGEPMMLRVDIEAAAVLKNTDVESTNATNKKSAKKRQSELDACVLFCSFAPKNKVRADSLISPVWQVVNMSPNEAPWHGISLVPLPPNPFQTGKIPVRFGPPGPIIDVRVSLRVPNLPGEEIECAFRLQDSNGLEFGEPLQLSVVVTGKQTPRQKPDYQAQIRQIQGMGFSDANAIRQVLEKTQGDVEAAVEMMTITN